MTTLAHGSVLGGPRNGGVAARRAVIRWAWRMFRREWRQQALVVTLLTVAVAAAIGSITIAYNAVPADDGDFGSANQVLTFDSSDPQKLQAGLDSAKKSFGAIDVIGHRSVRVPGSVETVDYRSQVPGGPYGGELLALRRGSYPVGPRPGRRDRWGGGVSSARDRVEPGARRATTDRRGHRRKPEQAERRVRSRLSIVREPGPGRRARRRRCGVDIERLLLSYPSATAPARPSRAP